LLLSSELAIWRHGRSYSTPLSDSTMSMLRILPCNKKLVITVKANVQTIDKATMLNDI
jgi:hypothetical protein